MYDVFNLTMKIQIALSHYTFLFKTNLIATKMSLYIKRCQSPKQNLLQVYLQDNIFSMTKHHQNNSCLLYPRLWLHERHGRLSIDTMFSMIKQVHKK